MTKLVTFDFWNTIFDASGGIERNQYRINALQENIFCNKLPDGFSLDSIIQDMYEHFNKVWIEQKITPNAVSMLYYVKNKFGINVSQDIIEKTAKQIDEAVLYFPPQLMKGLSTALARLDQKFRLAIVCDTGFSSGNTLRSLLNTENVLHYFSAFSFSNETGIAKPNPKAFWKVLDKLNITPEEAIHIGDIERTDIDGAKATGMRAIHFTGDLTAGPYNKSTVPTTADFESDSWQSITDWILNNA